ncbi:hypothetical protein ATCC90586_009039 [Pythium insidiosum]|nr:hypothetical protein ATCC90586_009039 [Pythium insidiosum]
MATSAALSGAMDAEYIEMMHHRAMHQVNEVLHVCLHTPRTQDRWHCLQRDKHLELYAKKSNTTRSVFFLGVNEIYCGFDEVHELLSFDNRKQFHLVMKLLYGRNFRDGDLTGLRHPRACDVTYDVADVQHSALWMSMQARRDSVMGRDNRLEFFQALMILHPDRSTIGSSTLGAEEMDIGDEDEDDDFDESDGYLGDYDMYASIGPDISKTPDDVPEIYRRTSMLSLGLMDGYEPPDADTGASLPVKAAPSPPTGSRKGVTYADAAWEARRLKLMKVICSPACTLVDRSLMRECCEAVAAAFHVRCAFIARVEELFVVLEHVVGTHRLSPIDHFLRAETPCDHVLARSGHPLVVMNCHLDSRTKDLELVRDLDMRFLVGASIRVRGLPIACLCAFSMGPSEDDDRDQAPVPTVVPNVTNVGLKTLQRAAQFIEEELERLVDGLDI